MMHLIVLIIIGFTIFELAPLSSFAESSNKLPNVVWEKEFGDGNFWYEPSSMAMSGNHGTLIAAKARITPGENASDTTGRSALWFWRIDQDGEKILEKLIELPKTILMNGKTVEVNTDSSNVTGMCSLENGDSLLVIELVPGYPWIVRINKTGKQTLTKELTGPKRQVSFSKIIPLVDEKYLLIGHESFDSFMMQIDKEGNILWEKKRDRGNKEIIVDGLRTDNNEIILVENSAETGPFRIGPSSVWVSKYDEKGILKSEISFPGRYGHIAKSSDGNYGIVFDASTIGSQDIKVALLNPHLKELWKSQVLQVRSGLSDFKIAAAPNGSFWVVGSYGLRQFNLSVTKIDKTGRKIIEVLDSEKISSNYHLVSSKNAFYIGYSAYKELERRKISKNVGLIKFIDK
jgi:hypothetical protein